jgi:diketogulonate reductase-like aldo/keto reductase
MKAEGRIRYIGSTDYTTSALPELARVLVTEPGIDFVQLGYSLAARVSETELLPTAAARRTGPPSLSTSRSSRAICFAGCAGEALPGWARDMDCTSWAQLFLKYILPNPPSPEYPGDQQFRAHENNLGAGFDRLLTRADASRSAALGRWLSVLDFILRDRADR